MRPSLHNWRRFGSAISCGAKSGTLAVRRRNPFQSFVNFVFLLQIMFWQTVLILWATVPVYLGANFARFIPRVL